MAILIGLIILAAIALYVGRPLRPSRRAAESDGGAALSLAAQRESLYTQIKELDLDHATGKVNEEDYTRVRAELVAEAAGVLRQIDDVVQPAAPQVAKAASSAALTSDDELEAAIAARRKARSASAPKSTDVAVEAAIAARRKSAASASSGPVCPQCGKPIGADDAFCAKCGAALQSQATL